MPSGRSGSERVVIDLGGVSLFSCGVVRADQRAALSFQTIIGPL